MKITRTNVSCIPFCMVLLVLILGGSQVKSQNVSGREFWFAFPSVQVVEFYESPENEGPKFFIISDYCIDTGYIEIPGLNWDTTFSVVPGLYTEVHLPMRINGNPYWTGPGLGKKGIFVHAPFPITVYAVPYKPFSCDGETVLPVDLLGTEYVGAIRGGGGA